MNARLRKYKYCYSNEGAFMQRVYQDHFCVEVQIRVGSVEVQIRVGSVEVQIRVGSVEVQIRVGRDFFKYGEKKLPFRNYPDTCGRGLNDDSRVNKPNLASFDSEQGI